MGSGEMTDAPMASTDEMSVTEKPAKSVGRKGFDPEVRDRVVRAATDVMSTEGLGAIKARPLAAKAGISVGSIYNLFSDLDDLVRLVNGKTYDDLLEAERAALAAAQAAGANPRAQMLVLAQAYLDFVATHQTRWQSTLAFNRSRTEPPPDWYLAKEAALFDVIENALAGFPGAKDETRRRQTARALWASVHGIVTIAVADGFLMQPIDDVWVQIEIIVNAVASSLEGAPS
ncbi:MAG: WHG domain-containing protein [Pseudomonadota bacterium]